VGQRGSLEDNREKKILSPLPRIKPPFLDQPAIPSATTLTELVGSYYVKASRTSKIVLLRNVKFYMKIIDLYFHMDHKCKY